MDTIVKCYDPNYLDAYNDIRANIEDWIEEAITMYKPLEVDPLRRSKLPPPLIFD